MKDMSPYSTQGRIYFVPETDDPVAKARLVEGEEAPSFRDYWQVVRKHRWKIAWCFIVAVVLTGVIVFSMTPIYNARVTIMVERKGPQVVNIQQVVSESLDSPNDQDFYQSQYEMLKSRSLAADVIKGQALDKDPVFTGEGRAVAVVRKLWASMTGWLTGLFTSQPSPANANPYGISSQLIDSYQGLVDIQPIKRSRLVNVVVATPDPELSARIANAHANAFIHQGLKLRSQASEEARKFLEAKLAELKDRVEKSETTLNEFRRGKGIISLDDKENIVVNRLADLNKDLTQAEADRIGLEAQARLIKKRDYDSLPAVISSPLISTLKGQLVQLEGQYAHLSSQFKPGYPAMAQLKSQIEETKQRLSEHIKGVVEGINSAYMAAAGKEAALKSQMDRQKSEALALKDAAVEYAILAREANTNNQLYNSVLERMKEISIAAELPASNVSIVDSAEIPRLPSKPQKRLMLMLSAIAGLMGGLGLAFISEHLDNTLRTPEEVERYLKCPNLVVVPDFFSVPKNAAKWKLPFSGRAPSLDSRLCVPGKSPMPANLRFTVITEAYRKLRTSILYSRPGQAPKTILFTSTTAGEGKTISVANAAIMFSHLGYNCLVIDADLRRPSCHRALRVENDRGLTDFLVGQGDLQRAIKPTSIANLSVLNCGSVAPNPTELIGSHKMREALSALKDQFDFVLIDSPPVMPVSDAVVLSNMVDGVVFVVRGQDTPKHLVKTAFSQLKTDHTNVLGVVLNRVDIRSAEYKDYNQYYDGEYYSSVRLA